MLHFIPRMIHMRYISLDILSAYAKFHITYLATAPEEIKIFGIIFFFFAASYGHYFKKWSDLSPKGTSSYIAQAWKKILSACSENMQNDFRILISWQISYLYYKNTLGYERGPK
jgi:hypothetical protein